MINVLKQYINFTIYAGRSTDNKPSNCGTGSKFIEVDTGTEYVYDSEAGKWTKMGSGGEAPVTHVYSLKASVPSNFAGYTAGDDFSPTDFSFTIVDEGGNTIDTIAYDFLSALQLIDDGDGYKFMTADGISPAFWCGLLDASENWASLTDLVAGTYTLAGVAYNSGDPVEIPANWLVNGTEGITLTTTFDVSATLVVAPSQE